MNITCYECGQAGHIWTNCPYLTKVRTAAVRADSTEDPERDPQEDDEALPPNKEGNTTLLSGCVRNSHSFEWTPLLEKCFESIKTLACKALILKPIDYDNPDLIWVITNGSKAGVGAIYGQGPNWKTCRPAGFMSKKFSNAQQHY